MMTPSKAKVLSRQIDSEARRTGWRPCPATRADHRYARVSPASPVLCLLCGQPALGAVAEHAPDLYTQPNERKP